MRSLKRQVSGDSRVLEPDRASARSGEGRLRLRISSLDSFWICPFDVSFPSIDPSWAARSSSPGSRSISPFSKRSRTVQNHSARLFRNRSGAPVDRRRAALHAWARQLELEEARLSTFRWASTPTDRSGPRVPSLNRPVGVPHCDAARRRHSDGGRDHSAGARPTTGRGCSSRVRAGCEGRWHEDHEP
jgi:hypothetical protein